MLAGVCRCCACVCVWICKQANRIENETVCLANRESIAIASIVHLVCRYIGSDSVKVNFRIEGTKKWEKTLPKLPINLVAKKKG